MNEDEPTLTRTDADGWHYDPPRPCAGVWTSTSGLIRRKSGHEKMPGKWRAPRCCEVHMMPWGHLPPGVVQ